MNNNALKVHPKDNVAIATQPLKKGSDVMINGVIICQTSEDVAAGHKIALTAIPTKGPVIRYGEIIVEATRPINPGEWVHIHNTKPILASG